jgi:hypothetical protein
MAESKGNVSNITWAQDLPGIITAQSINDGTQCNTGDYLSSNACVQCPTGKFSNVTGTTSCTNRWPASYSATTAASSCTLCKIGTYNPDFGASQCIACPTGYGCLQQILKTGATNPNDPLSCILAGTETPVLCKAGEYSSTFWGGCLTCELGTYNGVSGVSSCTNCASGTYASKRGELFCNYCLAGT